MTNSILYDIYLLCLNRFNSSLDTKTPESATSTRYNNIFLKLSCLFLFLYTSLYIVKERDNHIFLLLSGICFVIFVLANKETNKKLKKRIQISSIVLRLVFNLCIFLLSCIVSLIPYKDDEVEEHKEKRSEQYSLYGLVTNQAFIPIIMKHFSGYNNVDQEEKTGTNRLFSLITDPDFLSTIMEYLNESSRPSSTLNRAFVSDEDGPAVGEQVFGADLSQQII